MWLFLGNFRKNLLLFIITSGDAGWDSILKTTKIKLLELLYILRRFDYQPIRKTNQKGCK